MRLYPRAIWQLFLLTVDESRTVRRWIADATPAVHVLPVSVARTAIGA